MEIIQSATEVVIPSKSYKDALNGGLYSSGRQGDSMRKVPQRQGGPPQIMKKPMENGYNKEDKMKIVMGEPCQQQIERLGRSLVGESMKPIDFKYTIEKLIKERCNIIDVAIVTFDSKLKAEEALSKGLKPL